MITIDDFKKVELKVAKVISAERVKGSDKLLKLEVDLGLEKRHIIAGIGKAYNPEDLIGKEIVIVANLEPRSLMGLESQGMVLAANAESGPVLIMPDKEVASGIEIR
ncbi:MAG: methionine--tRNA ligase subunit beta [Candidatus Yanofskybacteria bacterium RIFCSPHIGHO2_02_FULL_43_22]|uniref:Methionine--tRNA ligase n=1 Tax=Candidatus Yanofskybacteria bacterium RIFCSPHIGHO2_02_FULL_43_22 TaxID=1802681 RepID=A0A1F8FK32_9BACT|nr:MAG: methionine--tRNA ligase subunit beta [Candidatus Yanofskybacteria bacterium RIFCSPHIGHO2_02_FULL_43_22]